MNSANFKKRIFTSLLALSLAGTICILIQDEAKAANLFEKAVTLYKNGDHKLAAHYFKHIVNNQPEHWKSHYYLADIYLRANELTLARKYYNSCVVNYPDIPTCKHIVKALAHIDNLEAQAAGGTDRKNTPGADEATIASDSNLSTEEKARLALATKLEKEENERVEAKIKEAKDRRDKIIEEGNREANAVLAEARNTIEQMHRNSNWFVKNTRTGVVSVGLPTFVVDGVMAKAEARAAQIRDTAQVRARGIHIPKGDTSKTRALAQQLKAPEGKSGTRLNHIGTNTYVRNYVHSDKGSNQEKSEKRKIAAGENKLQ